MTTEQNTNGSRRVFLKMAVSSGFALGMYALPFGISNAAPDQGKDKPDPTQRLAAFVQIDSDGSVTVTINRLEMGQGVSTGLAMILAEELDADWSKVKAKHGGNEPEYVDPVFKIHLTAASASIRNSYRQYRELGARCRKMLVSAAAKKLGVDPGLLRTENGFVISEKGQRLAYGDLANDAMAQAVPETPALKDPKAFALIGQPKGRIDATAKSTGQQKYGIDLRLPGLMTAVIVRPPRFGGKLKSVNESGALAVKGVKAVLRVPVDYGGESVAVIGDSYWAVKNGRDALKLQWEIAQGNGPDSAALFSKYRELAGQPGNITVYEADHTLLEKAPKKISATFEFPYLAHASMEPLNCTVDYQGEQAEVWVGTQIPGLDSRAVSDALGIAQSAVKINNLMTGGAFGRRSTPNSDFVVEACQVVKAARAAGISAPIKTVWSREDDMASGYYRPMYVHQADIGFDDNGKILAWNHVIVGQSAVKGTAYEPFMMRNGIDITMTNGMKVPYEIPMHLSLHYAEVDVPVATWRSVANSHTAYVMQTLVDDIARAANQDPVDYRLALLGEKGGLQKAALRLAVEKSGYGKKELPEGWAWGVAAHDMSGSSIAYVVEVSIQDGRPKLHRVTAGVNCNLAVNPLSIEAQIQGGLVMALGTCLPGSAISFTNGAIEQTNFDRFRVARMTDIPEVEVHLVPGDDAPTGVGELAVPPLAPAFANAIARLGGQAPKALPFDVLS